MASSNRTSPALDNVTHIDEARRKRDVDRPERDRSNASTVKNRKLNGAKKGTRFNHEKVAAIKAAIANGTYSIDPQRIADKFIEQESP